MATDRSLERLLWLDGEIMEVGGGFWVGIRASLVPAGPERPHGIDYSLCLFGRGGERLICYDNAHPVAKGSGPGKRKGKHRDHVHKGTRVRPYAYVDAETLLTDFWDDVYKLLKKEGIP